MNDGAADASVAEAAGHAGPGRTDGSGLAARRVGLVGLGSRATMWAEGLATGGRLVAFCDNNSHRMRVQREWLRERMEYRQVACYPADAFPEMIAHEDLDTVVVCTPDVTHERYVVAALDAGCDVIVEKPLTISEDGCRAIVAAQSRSGREVRVAFNYRYNPIHEQVRQVLRSGAIGDVGSVHFDWALDLHHGADYFRRWHREKARSGGLLVHKSSHHFDLVSWWLGAEPERVFADGRLFFYGHEAGQARGLDRGDVREHRAGQEPDPFAMDLAASERMRSLYLEAEDEDGYRRDTSVFAPGVSIEDDMAVLVRYDSRATMTYHLTAYSPWEGYRVTFNGSAGRLELEVEESAWADPAGGTMSATITGQAEPPTPRARLLLRPMWAKPELLPPAAVSGAHGGGDLRMVADLLGEGSDPLGRHASFADGIRAAMTGVSANRSIATGQPVDVGAVLRDILAGPSPAGHGVHDDQQPFVNGKGS
jgi:predicted dehydrogenase